MKPTRRTLVQMLGLAPMTGRIVAKEIADNAVISTTGMAEALPGVGVAADLQSAEDGLGLSLRRDKDRNNFFNHIRVFGIPEFLKEEIRERSKSVHHLEYDIAAKKSWSLAAKIHEQRTRNYQHYIDNLDRSYEHEIARKAWEKLTNLKSFWRPW